MGCSRQSNHPQSVCKQNCLFRRVICIVRFICFRRNELAEFPTWIIIKRRITIYSRLNVCDNWRMFHFACILCRYKLLYLYFCSPIFLSFYTFCYFYSIYIGNSLLCVIINIWRSVERTSLSRYPILPSPNVYASSNRRRERSFLPSWWQETGREKHEEVQRGTQTE